ncbi:HAD-IA family hydrolase [Streptomyces sp. MUM 178J]|nr:HAD-IA family hydrolase [Streptomyces sp. MUM 178J]WRQ79822.1 HAD-IA family hydrolase [Streptomyces sp. MUM 178J]
MGSGRPYDAVLCDFDNVIRFYDLTRVARLERLAGLAEGTTADVAYAPEVDLPLLLGRIGKAEWVDSIARGLGHDVSPSQAHELGTAFAEAPFWVDDVVVAMLRRIREHLPLVLVTNATLDLESDLEALGLSDLADHVVSSARVGVAKPDRAIYEIAVKRAGVAMERCLFVDDSLENVEAAVALEMTGVHYRRQGDLHEALAPVLGG